MAIVKIEEVYLYTTQQGYDQAEMIQAKAVMDHSGIPYIHLNYNDAQQTQEVLDSVNTWWTGPPLSLPAVDKYPFVVYTELHDDIPSRQSPVKYKKGIEDITAFPEFYNSIMSNSKI